MWVESEGEERESCKVERRHKVRLSKFRCVETIRFFRKIELNAIGMRLSTRPLNTQAFPGEDSLVAVLRGDRSCGQSEAEGFLRVLEDSH